MASSSSVPLPSSDVHAATYEHDATQSVEAVDVDQIQAVSIHRKRKPRPKMTPDSLMRAVIDPGFETHFSKRARLTGKKGAELTELLALLHSYEGWARLKFPFLTFSAFIQQAEKFGSTKKINVR
jgi:Replication Fork Protection Component Swi3